MALFSTSFGTYQKSRSPRFFKPMIMDNIYEILNEANRISKDFVTNFTKPGVQIEPSKRVKIAWVERYGIAFENIFYALEQRKKQPRIDYSLVLLLRGTLLDTHIVFYFASIYYNSTITAQEKQEKIELEFEKFYINQLHHQFADLNTFKNVVPDLYDKMVESILDEYGFCFKEDSDFESLRTDKDYSSTISSLKFRKNDFPSFSGLVNKIREVEIMNGYDIAYAWYSYFSKIEHFGVLTYQRTLGITHQISIWESIKICLVGLQYVMDLTDRMLPQVKEIADMNTTLINKPSSFIPQF